MNKIFKFSALVAMASLLVAGCQPELNTDQFTGGDIVLSAYGPNPVYRGGELTFVGANLEKVASVEIPGVDAITEIEVLQKGNPSKIKITVPVEGPEVGFVTLVSKSGVKVESKAELTYTEPIVFDSFSPASAMPGDVVTIKGDYLYNVKEVIFAGDAIVNEFVSQDRHELKVKVPATAISGLVNLGDEDQIANPDAFANKIASKSALSLGNPTVSGVSATNYKAGQTLTINGTYLCMVQKVAFDGIDVTEFTVSDDWKKLSLTIPAAAGKGDYNLVTYEGNQVKVGSFFPVKPSSVTATPAPVKAGAELTIAGSDLDLVTSVIFPDGVTPEYAYAEGKITVTVPFNCNDEKDIRLATASRDTVDLAYELVKPEVTAIDTDLTALQTLTIEGTDLDLVIALEFGGAQSVDSTDFVSQSATKIEAKVPALALTGKVVMDLTNGKNITAGTLNVTSLENCFILEVVGSPKAGECLILNVKNESHLTKVEMAGEECPFFLKGATVYALIPGSCAENTKVKLVSDNGEYEEVIYINPSQFFEQTIWTGMAELGWSGAGQVYVIGEGEMVNTYNAQVGDVVRFYFTQTGDDPQCQFWNGHWGTQYDTWTDFSAGFIEVILTPEMITNLSSVQGWGGSFLCQGQGVILTKVVLIQDVSEVTIMSGAVDLKDWGLNLSVGIDNSANGATYEAPYTFFADNNVAEGMSLKFYVTLKNAESTWWQLQIFSGSWGGMNLGFNEEQPKNVNANLIEMQNYGGFGVIEIPINASMANDLANAATNWGGSMILQGENLIINRATLKKF